MAPAENFSPAGSSSYESDTMSVGDGTWDFTKNTFLLPNLVPLNFETMQYNGMGNRFSTVEQYHTIILAHGVIAAIVFLFIIPAAIFSARFYTRRPGFAIKYHAYLNVLATLLATVVFVLGWFAVGPNRSLTNPHHGVGVAIYTLILLQAIGGRMVRHIRHRSVRVTVHQWSGRLITMLGFIQVPLGLVLYGSPKFTFVLYGVWMSFLLLLYFIYDYRRGSDIDRRGRGGRDEDVFTSGGKSEKKSGGWMRWLGPLAAGAGAVALLKGRNKSRSRSRSHSRSRGARSRSRGPEVIASRRTSYIEEEKYTESGHDHGKRKEGGFMGKVMGAGAALGAGALIANLMGRRRNNPRDEEYSAVATDTPSHRRNKLRRGPARSHRYESEISEDTSRGGRNSPLLPGPGNPTAAAAAISAATSRPGTHTQRPRTPPHSHQRGHRPQDSLLTSDYSSYRSPSRRTPPKSGGVGKGLLAGLGLGWFGKKMADRRDRKEEDRMRIDEEERRSGHRGSRHTGDGYGSPTRRDSRRPPAGRRPPPTASGMSDLSSSIIESRPVLSTPSRPTAPPVTPAAQTGHSHSRTQSRHDIIEPAVMPAMPPDPHGILHRNDSGSEAYISSGGRPHRRHSSRRRREGDAAASAAAASASRLAEQEARRHDGSSPNNPVSVKVKYDDRNVTLRRLTEEEAAAARHEPRRPVQRDESPSSAGEGTSSARRYRRDSSLRPAERVAEQRVEQDDHLGPLSPPNPAFAGGRRPKDSAYYSGGQGSGPAGGMAAAGHTVSSIGSPDSHGTWSALSPSPSGPLREPTASAADRRRRRRLERRDGSSRPGGSGTVEFS